MLRTKTCGELRKADIGEEVKLCGWVQSRRDHGGIIFIDLRDRYGLTQVVFDPKHNDNCHKLAESLRREFVIQVSGKVRARSEGMTNPKMVTGEIEIITQELEVLSAAETPPIEIDDTSKVNEDFRLQYRYLDLRRPVMQRRLLLRHKVFLATRNYLASEGFAEIETPILARSTPEGARDYLVPSRVHPGKFFALPQSPQLFKQLLMVSGFDRYFQLARCFRDEDLRADRQPEFTQIDIEMSFIEQDDIISINEGLMKHIWKEVKGVDIKTPFQRMTYKEAMTRYGSDKPDVRFGLELTDVCDVMKKSDFKVFKSLVEKGGSVVGLNAEKCATFSRKDIEDLEEVAKIYGAKGLAWMKMDDKLESNIVKFFSEDCQKEIIKTMNVRKGDLLLFIAEARESEAQTIMGQVRVHLGKKLKLIDESKDAFLWVVDFPVFEWSEEEKRFMSMHHPFTSPKKEDIELVESDPGKARANAYDLTLNGVELGGGSIRIHDSELQQRMFKALGITPEEQKAKFGFLLEAFKYGAPPHGGIAFGFDRLIALLAGTESIRDVIAFPKNKACQSLMDSAPNSVDEKQLKELGVKLDLKK